jgi:Fe-S-cluster-containing hydrogenase component 2
MEQKERDFNSGILVENRAGAVLPPQKEWEAKKGGYVIIECPQRIPCNPCATSCPTGAVVPFKDINDVPVIDYSKCTGCGLCVAKCPGLACFVVDISGADAIVKLPYELVPVPEKGEKVKCLNRRGEEVTDGVVENVAEPFKDQTKVISVKIPKNLAGEVRAIKVVR